jgi:hypothetical protein
MKQREACGRRADRWALGVVCCGLFFVAFGPLAWLMGQGAGAVKQQPSAELIALGHKFEGSGGCSGANCHGGAQPKPPPAPPGNETRTWQEKDKHAHAFETLTKPESDEILKKAGGAGKAAESALCTNCHTLAAPENQRMANFKIEEGVTCNACHGPYEKWEKPHNQPGGANALRTEAGYASLKAESVPYSTASPEHKKMLTTHGLFDTRPILARAEKCTSCHLAIDAKLVEAGHPQPIFELAYYGELEPPHWREPGGYFGTKVWAAGQVVCLRDAAKQLAERAGGGASDKLVKEAADQTLGHLNVFKALVGAKATAALEGAGKDLKSAGGDKAKMAEAASKIAQVAEQLMPAVAQMNADEGKTAAALSKIVADATAAKELGIRGAEQQALALASLCAAYEKGKQPGDAEAIRKIIDEQLLPTLDPAGFKADEFEKARAALAGKLGPLVGAAKAADAPDIR